MKKAISMLILITVAVFAVESQGKSNDYIAHCNFAFGFSYAFGGTVSGSGGLGLTLVDRFGDSYHFNYSPDKDDDPRTGFNIMLSMPFYYQEYFSTGVYGQALLNGLFNDSLTLYYGGGLYAEGKYKQFSLRAGIGLAGANMSKSIGKLAPAWPYDPGYYTGSTFIKPGEKLAASSYDFLGLTWNLSLKYYPFIKSAGFSRALFLQLGYFYFSGKTVSGYKLKLGGTDIPAPASLPSFKVAPVHHVSLLFGIGL